MSIFRELTEGLPRQGPGSPEATLRSLGLTRELPDRPRILDVGCGSGAQTIELARATRGEISAVDTRRRFLDDLPEPARDAGVLPQITTVNASMFDMQFPAESFDLIWSEGAIYIAGLAAWLGAWGGVLYIAVCAAGLGAWRRFLKPGGGLRFPELSGLVPNPPAETAQFWARN